MREYSEDYQDLYEEEDEQEFEDATDDYYNESDYEEDLSGYDMEDERLARNAKVGIRSERPSEMRFGNRVGRKDY